MDRLTLINRTLLRIGSTPLLSEADPGADQKLAVYDSVLENALAYPFSFAKAFVRLTRLAEAPIAHWAYQYQLPSNRIGALRAVYAASDTRTPTTEYDLRGDVLLSSLPQLWMEFMSAETIGRWPGSFTEFLQQALMAEFALSIREDRALHDRLYQKAFGTPQQMSQGGLYGRVMEMDAQQVPEREIAGGYNPLIDARN